MSEREQIVSFIRAQEVIGADYALEAEKGTIRRAAYGGGCLILSRVADAIERGDHLTEAGQ